MNGPSPETPPLVSSPAPEPTKLNTRGYLFWGVGASAFVLVILVVLFSRTDVQAIEHALKPQALDKAERHFRVKLGWLTLGAARLATDLCNVNEEIQCVLQAVRSVDLSYYELQREHVENTASDGFAEIRQTMIERKWQPFVSVREGDTQVQIFTPARGTSSNTGICFVVFANEHLVIGSGRIQTDALKPILQKHLPERYKDLHL